MASTVIENCNFLPLYFSSTRSSNSLSLNSQHRTLLQWWKDWAVLVTLHRNQPPRRTTLQENQDLLCTFVLNLGPNGKRASIDFLKSQKGGVSCLSYLCHLIWIYLTGRIRLQGEDFNRTCSNGSATSSPIVRAVVALLGLYWCEGIF